MAALERDDFEEELLGEAGPPELPPPARTHDGVTAAWLRAAAASALQPSPDDKARAMEDEARAIEDAPVRRARHALRAAGAGMLMGLPYPGCMTGAAARHDAARLQQQRRRQRHQRVRYA